VGVSLRLTLDYSILLRLCLRRIPERHSLEFNVEVFR
jgi:hypothetical protein